jgi:glutathione synthase/RimK-type ligase-like ATP-grasp enzyme
MFVMLSDGAGLTSRQCATLLSRDGHRVEALSPGGLCLCRMTRHVRRVHRVPPIGRDPFGWLDAALDIAARRRADLLLPVQEQVAVMSLARDRIEAAGLRTAVPDFSALAQVQDKVSAHRTMTRLGVPQPPTVVATTASELEAAAGAADEAGQRRGVFVKTPIGTASAGVRLVRSRDELRRLTADYEGQEVLVQQGVRGPLVMVQAVFADGELVAFHGCERVREGAQGGASHKRGLALPEAREHLARLGGALGWHGALSADVILGPAGPVFIDINPRLVEPMNAMVSGVDLVRAMVEVAGTRGRAAPPAGKPGFPVHPAAPPAGRAGVRTHQLLIAVLGAAQGGRRRDVAGELGQALMHRGDYRGSREELTPRGGDLLAGLPVAVIGLAALVRPAAWRYFTSGSTGAYSLTPDAWRQLTTAWRELDQATQVQAAPAPAGERGYLAASTTARSA